MKFNKHLFFRKAHRYLGLFIGIQFLGWTISGLYFSWNNIDEVHGDHFRKSEQFLESELNLVSPSTAIQNLKSTKAVDSIYSIELIRLLDKPVYQINFFSGHAGEGMHLHVHHVLADAQTGSIREPLTEKEATILATEQVKASAKIETVQFLTPTDDHHEYRDKPLPAYAVTFSDPDCTVYVSSELGTYETIRHSQWRTWDFLWMLHTMDYKSRDNLNNWLLKGFSIFGLITVCSGFILFYLSSKTIKKITT